MDRGKNNDFEAILITLSKIRLIQFCMSERWLLSENICSACMRSTSFVKYCRSIDEYAWRCNNPKFQGMSDDANILAATFR